jgi:hypothetical protein
VKVDTIVSVFMRLYPSIMRLFYIELQTGSRKKVGED